MSSREDVKLHKHLKTYNEFKDTFIKNDRKQNLTIDEKLWLLTEQLDILLTSFDLASYAPKPLDVELWIRDENINFLIKELERIMTSKFTAKNEFARAYKLWEKTLAFTARRSFHHFLIYMELDRSEARRVYHNKRDVILKPFAYYFELMMFTDGFNYLSDSKPPSAGKSFEVNYASAWVYGLRLDSSVLRISVAEDNVYTASKNIMAIIRDDRYHDVFPYFKELANKEQNLFEIEKINGWKITGADVEASHLAVPMGGQIEGKRANALVIVDDSLKQDDAHNEDLMLKNWNKFLSSIDARKDSDNVKTLMIGTMWHPNDLLGRMIEYESEGAKVVDSTKFKYTKELWKNGQIVGVIIQTPMLDYETDETTCKYVMSTENARKKRASLDEFLWQSAYQQKPIPPAGRLFEHSELKEYDEITNKQVRYNGGIYNFNEYAKMSIDPTRKGKDKIACPIFKTVDEFDNLEFMVDVIFKGKAMDEVYDDIITKIVLHNINYVILENNIDTSLKTVLEDRLKQYNIRNGTNYVCEFEEEYSTARKKTRIKDESYLIKTQMVFPARGTYSPNSELGQFMDNVTRYSDLIPNKNDDAPDSLAIYANKVMRVRHKSEATATVHSINILYS